MNTMEEARNNFILRRIRLIISVIIYTTVVTIYCIRKFNNLNEFIIAIMNIGLLKISIILSFTAVIIDFIKYTESKRKINKIMMSFTDLLIDFKRSTIVKDINNLIQSMKPNDSLFKVTFITNSVPNRIDNECIEKIMNLFHANMFSYNFEFIENDFCENHVVPKYRIDIVGKTHEYEKLLSIIEDTSTDETDMIGILNEVFKTHETVFNDAHIVPSYHNYNCKI